jgi:hypothetical protein
MPGRIVRSALTGFALAAVLCLAAPPRAEAASWRWGESQAPGSSLAAAWMQAATFWHWLQGRVLSAAGDATWRKSGTPSGAAATATDTPPPPPAPAPTGDQGPMIDPNGLPPH